jgi:PAS domain S-box-containing protein
VAQSATPLIVDDYHHWPGRLTDDVPFCGVVSVPILWQSRVLGVISICDPQPERFGSEDLESVRLLAAQAAVAITNARLYAARQQELAERQRAEAALRQRDAILEAVAFAAEQFLKTSDWQADIERVLERLGQKINASHVYIFENHQTETGVLATSQRHEWVAPGQRPEIDNPLYQNSTILESGFERWTTALSQGEPFYGNLNSFSPSEAEFLIPRGIRALLDVPIFVGETWWGIIGFDDCVVPRAWSLVEVDTLRLAASIISAAIQRQQAEVAVRESEARYRQAISAAEAVPYQLDYATDRYTFIGQGILKLTGYPAQEVTPALLRRLIQESQMRGQYAHLARDEAIRQVRQGSEGAWLSDLRWLTRNGESRWVTDAAVQVRDERGQPVGSIGILQDITERKRAEEEIHQLNAQLEERVRQRTAQLEATNRELEAFSYSVSHDLRAPLRAVTGFARILEEEHLPHLPSEARRLLDRIQDSGRRMSQLIDDLLSLSRLTRAELRRQPVQVSRLVHEALLHQQQHDPQRQVKWQIAPDLTVHGDPNLLKIALENLLSNAWKFTAQRPQAHIEFGSELQPDGERAFFVRDNGAGFDMRYAGKLFGAFQRLHRSEEFEGTGIGLATVQRIIHRHGGRVWAESALDQGATFYFTLGRD